MTIETQKVAAKIQEVTVAQLAEIFDRKHGARFVSFVARTDPQKQLQKGAPNVYKVAYVSGIVHWAYSTSVNNQRERENLPADFVPAPRKWGVRLADSALVEHEGKFYLEVKVEKSLNHYYIDKATGDVIPNEDVEKFLKPKKEGTRQGVSQVIILRDYMLDNIQSIKHEGVEYVVLKHRWIDEHVRADSVSFV